MDYMTKEEIVKDCIEHFDEDDIEAVKSTEEKDLIGYNHEFGMHIRNHYGLWKRDNPLVASWFEAAPAGDRSQIIKGTDCHPCHPDAISMSIIRAIWNEVNNSKPDLLSLVN